MSWKLAHRCLNQMKTYDTDDTSLPGDRLAAPREVARIEAESAVLEVTAADADSMNPLRAKLSVGSLATELEFSLLAVVGALGTCVRTLVPGRAGDTYSSPTQSENRQDMRDA